MCYIDMGGTSFSCFQDIVDSGFFIWMNFINCKILVHFYCKTYGCAESIVVFSCVMMDRGWFNNVLCVFCRLGAFMLILNPFLFINDCVIFTASSS